MKQHLLLMCMLLLLNWSTMGQNATVPSSGDGSSGNPYQIASLENLYWIAESNTRWSSHYIQTANIDASTTSTWDGGAGWSPIGNDGAKFLGNYDGGNFSISGLNINRPNTNNVGLFGHVGYDGDGVLIKNLNLTDINVIGGRGSGTLAGRVTGNNNNLIENCNAVGGTVVGDGATGGLVGSHNSYVENPANKNNHPVLSKSYADIDVSWSRKPGSGADKIGGLTGCNQKGQIQHCYARGSVTVNNDPAVSAINTDGSEPSRIGGLSGCILIRGYVIKSYSTGKITTYGTVRNVGGIVGNGGTGGSNGDTENCFWDTETSGQPTSAPTSGCTGKSTTEMQTPITFTSAGWDFVSLWAISPATNNNYPNLDGKSAITWNGNTNSDWVTGSNWSTGSLPTASDDVIITGAPNTPIIGFGTTASCHHLLVESGGELTVEGTLDNSGTVTVNSDASASGSLILNGTLTGNVTYNRYLVNDRWHLVSSPVIGETFNSTFFAENNIDHNPDLTQFALIDYNTENNQWNPYPKQSAAGTFASAKGFLMARYVDSSAGGTVNFTGTVAKEDLSFAHSILGYRWNAVGNPFPSAININPNAVAINNFIDKNSSNLEPSYSAIYYWDDSQAKYEIINESSPAFYAAPGQGFFVKSASSDSPVIDFPLSLRTHQGSVALKSGQAEWPQLEITAKSGDAESAATVKFVEGSTTGLDVGYDAGKFKSNTEMNLFTKLVDDNGVDFGLQCLPPTQMESLAIPVGLDVKSAGEIVFNINYSSLPENMIPVLEDRLLNIKTPFETGSNNYTSTVIESESEYGRFYISFSSTTDVAQIQNVHIFRAWYSNNTIHIQGKVEGSAVVTLYDINGRALMQKKVMDENHNSLSIPNFGNGIYLLKIIGSNKTELLKVPVLK